MLKPEYLCLIVVLGLAAVQLVEGVPYFYRRKLPGKRTQEVHNELVHLYNIVNETREELNDIPTELDTEKQIQIDDQMLHLKNIDVDTSGNVDLNVTTKDHHRRLVQFFHILKNLGATSIRERIEEVLSKMEKAYETTTYPEEVNINVTSLNETDKKKVLRKILDDLGVYVRTLHTKVY